MKLTLRFKGGKGSGHFGHRGRPGKQGGGLPEGGPAIDANYVEGDLDENGNQVGPKYDFGDGYTGVNDGKFLTMSRHGYPIHQIYIPKLSESEIEAAAKSYIKRSGGHHTILGLSKLDPPSIKGKGYTRGQMKVFIQSDAKLDELTLTDEQIENYLDDLYGIKR